MNENTTNVGSQPTDALNGASVLIAGASGGLGSAIARRLAEKCANLTLVSKTQRKLDALNLRGATMAADLRDPHQAEAAVELAVATYDKLDVVINAVGVVAFGPIGDLSVDALEELFMTNVFVPVFLARSALDRMDRGGTIVNISGVISEQNLPGMAAYGASKAAVRSFGEALQREARRRKVRVLDARPPHTETGLAGRAIEGNAPQMPTGMKPERVAEVICEAIATGTKDLPSTAFNVG